MQTFFCSENNISARKAKITDLETVHHIKDVLRLKKGERVNLFDQRNRRYLSVIEELSAQNIICKIEDMSVPLENKKIKLTVACAIPKKSRIDDIIDKLTQLGVERIIPLITKRTIVKLDKKKKDARRRRWEKIALVAAQQSQRHSLPVIEPITDINKVITESGDFDLRLIPHLSDERKTLKEIFSKASPKSVLILIGPEGDFTPEEVNLAKKNGFIAVTLGENVLRVETAAVAVASFIRLNEDY